MKCLVVLCLVAVRLHLEHDVPFQGTCQGKVRLHWGGSGTATKLLVGAGVRGAPGKALNAGLVQQVKPRRKRARGDPIAACSCSVCGNRGDRARLCVWQQDRRWWTPVGTGEILILYMKDFFNLSD